MLLREVEYARPVGRRGGLAPLGARGSACSPGQTLVNVMKARAAAPDVLVDLADLEELRAIGFSSDGLLEIGAMATYAQVMGSSEVEVARPILAEVAGTIADVQVRNRGTVGGNVCVSDPTNHLPPLLVALDASFTIRGSAGERVVPADEFFVGVYVTAVGEGELLTKISVPPASDAEMQARASPQGAHGTYIVDAAASVLDEGTRIAIGCVAPSARQRREEKLPRRLLRRRGARSRDGLGASLDPPSDVHGSADYRTAWRDVGDTRGPASCREEKAAVWARLRQPAARSRST